jgi:hypothetical protein
MYKFQCRNTSNIIKQDIGSSPNVNNSIIKDLNDCEADEISNNEFKRKMMRMVNKIKEDMYKY